MPLGNGSLFRLFSAPNYRGRKCTHSSYTILRKFRQARIHKYIDQFINDGCNHFRRAATFALCLFTVFQNRPNEIQAAQPYTEAALNYSDHDSRADKEQNDKTACPEIGSEDIPLTISRSFPLYRGRTGGTIKSGDVKPVAIFLMSTSSTKNTAQRRSTAHRRQPLALAALRPTVQVIKAAAFSEMQRCCLPVHPHKAARSPPSRCFPVDRTILPAATAVAHPPPEGAGCPDWSRCGVTGKTAPPPCTIWTPDRQESR